MRITVEAWLRKYTNRFLPKGENGTLFAFLTSQTHAHEEHTIYCSGLTDHCTLP